MDLSEFLQFRYTLLHPKPNTFHPLELGGGGDVNRWTDGDVPIFCSRFGTQKFNFCIKTLPKNLFYNILCLSFQQGKLEWTAIFVSYERFVCHFINFS